MFTNNLKFMIITWIIVQPNIHMKKYDLNIRWLMKWALDPACTTFSLTSGWKCKWTKQLQPLLKLANETKGLLFYPTLNSQTKIHEKCVMRCIFIKISGVKELIIVGWFFFFWHFRLMTLNLIPSQIPPMHQLLCMAPIVSVGS